MTEESSSVTVALYGGLYQPLGQVARYESCEVDWVNLDVGTGQLVVSETSSFAPILMSVQKAPVLVVVTVNGIRWPGRIALLTFERPTGKPGSGTLTCTLVHEYVWLKYMMASQNGANPSLTGMPAFDTQTGPVATLVAYYINAAAQRLGAPIVAIPPNGDTSATVTLQGRFPVTLADLLTPVMANEGIVLDVDMWFERSKVPVDQPQPAHLPVIVFQPRQVPGVPALRWSDETSQLTKLHMELAAATGYKALVGLGGDGTAAVYDYVLDDPPEGTGGTYALPEVYVDSGGTTLGPDSQARGREGLIEHRGSTSLAFEVQDGRPWRFGEHYLSGDPAQILVAGIPFIDQITKVTANNSASNGLVITPTLGDLTVGENMTQLTVRAIASIKSQLRQLRAG